MMKMSSEHPVCRMMTACADGLIRRGVGFYWLFIVKRKKKKETPTIVTYGCIVGNYRLKKEEKNEWMGWYSESYLPVLFVRRDAKGDWVRSQRCVLDGGVVSKASAMGSGH